MSEKQHKKSKKNQTIPEEQVLTLPEIKPGSVKMDILLVTAQMQHQNGLRLNDYLKYSHFCRKKIQKLRKSFKLTQGKKKFQKVEITANLRL